MSLIATHCRAIAAQRAKFRGRVPLDFCYTVTPAVWDELHAELDRARASIGQPLPAADLRGRRNFLLLGTPVVMPPTPIREV